MQTIYIFLFTLFNAIFITNIYASSNCDMAMDKVRNTITKLKNKNIKEIIFSINEHKNPYKSKNVIKTKKDDNLTETAFISDSHPITEKHNPKHYFITDFAIEKTGKKEENKPKYIAKTAPYPPAAGLTRLEKIDIKYSRKKSQIYLDSNGKFRNLETNKLLDSDYIEKFIWDETGIFVFESKNKPETYIKYDLYASGLIEFKNGELSYISNHDDFFNTDGENVKTLVNLLKLYKIKGFENISMKISGASTWF